MSARDAPTDRVQGGESILARISRRKHEVRAAQEDREHAQAEDRDREDRAAPQVGPTAVADPLPTDADMPAIESLTPDSDYSGFLSPRVSEGLRRLALRRLWNSPEFAVRDGLEIYDGDYTSFEALGGIVTAEMRHELEVEARRRAEGLLSQDQAVPDADDESEDPRDRTRLMAAAGSPDPGDPMSDLPGRPVDGSCPGLVEGEPDESEDEI